MIANKKKIDFVVLRLLKEDKEIERHHFNVDEFDKMYAKEKEWRSKSSKHTAVRKTYYEMLDKVMELFYVSKELSKKQAEMMAEEAVSKKKIEYDTPWSTFITLDKLENIEPKAFKDVWLNILAHFNTGRDKDYYLYAIVSQ